MIQITENDLIVARIDAKRKALIKVSDVKPQSITGTAYVRGEPKPMVVGIKDVMANIGPKPETGWVFGVFVGEMVNIAVEEGRSIVYKITLDDDKKKMLHKCLRKWERILAKLNFGLEIHGPFANRLGAYAARKQKSRRDIMFLHAPCFRDFDTLEHTIIHESGHGYWRHHLDHSLQARVISAYTDYIQIKKTEVHKIQEVAHAFDDFEGSINGFIRQMRKEQKPVFRKMLLWIKDVHKITREELEKLRSGGLKTRKYFPSHDIIQSQVMPVVTNYGTKNVEEFFCESWAWYHQDKQMPAEVRKLIGEVHKIMQGIPDADMQLEIEESE